MLPYTAAREKVIEIVARLGRRPETETVALAAALERVLAEPISSDREYPPFDRSARDGYALRAADAAVGKSLKLIGEIPAGAVFAGKVGAGECAQIMTGAAVPAGADAVVMVEQTHAGARPDEIVLDKAAEPGQNIVPRGSEAKASQQLLAAGNRLGFAELSLAAQVGRSSVQVYRKPRAAILSTGDEVVGVEETPGPVQIRNSNSVSLGAQASLAGAEPVQLGNAPDRTDELARRIERGLSADLLIISGGVSMGKYDLVEDVLRGFGAEFHFDAIAIRPGRPAVFATCRGKPVFGLPGNPVSTMVTFELLVAPAIDLLGGTRARALPLLRALLAKPVRQKPGLTYFLPARLSWPGGVPEVEPLGWKGSGDVTALAESNCFLVVPESKTAREAGEWVDVLPRRDMI